MSKPYKLEQVRNYLIYQNHEKGIILQYQLYYPHEHLYYNVFKVWISVKVDKIRSNCFPSGELKLFSWFIKSLNQKGNKQFPCLGSQTARGSKYNCFGKQEKGTSGGEKYKKTKQTNKQEEGEGYKYCPWWCLFLWLGVMVGYLGFRCQDSPTIGRAGPSVTR